MPEFTATGTAASCCRTVRLHKNRPQAAKLLHISIVTRAVILADKNAVIAGMSGGNRDRGYLFIKSTAELGIHSFDVGPQGKFILLPACYPESFCHILSSHPHRLARESIRKPIPEYPVNELHTPIFMPGPHIRGIVRGIAHAFRTADKDGIGIAQQDRSLPHTHSFKP